MDGKITEIDTVSLDEANKALVIIDQTKLPGTIEMLSLTTAKEIWDAIYLLQVRGAPAIGVAPAIGMYVLSCRYDAKHMMHFMLHFVGTRNILIHPDRQQSIYPGHKAYGRCGDSPCK